MIDELMSESVSSQIWYGYVKTLGEKEAWKIAAEKKI